MKSIRNQLKDLIGLQWPVLLKMWIKSSRYSQFMRLQKEQEINNKQKIGPFLPEKAFEAVKP